MTSFLDLGLSVNCVKSAPPFDAWALSTEYSAALSAAPPSVGIRNYNEWGTATDRGIVIQSAGMVLVIGSDPDPNLRTLSVKSFDMRVASFIHSAIAPESTGQNVYTLGDSTQSVGQVNIQTGATILKILANLSNDYFPPEAPAKVMFDLTGVLNPAAQTGHFTVAGMTYQVIHSVE